MAKAAAVRARVYTIPPTEPFLDTLARAVLRGDLPRTPGAAPDLIDLPNWTILLPTRRACRALRESFLRMSGRAALLPRIRPLGDVDEEESFFAESHADTGDGETALDLPPAVDDLERRLALTALIGNWMQRVGVAPADARGFGIAEGGIAPAQASDLAASLMRLMDAIETEQVDLGKLVEIVPDQFAAHWQLTLDFLGVITELWPEYLRKRGLISAATRRNALMASQTTRLQENGSAFPIIAAGSTGSIPATAALLRAIAHLPNGAVVLPGLDLDLDAKGWKAIDADHPEHPQYGLKELLTLIGVERSDVMPLAGAEPDAAGGARLKLIAETMRPASSTEAWRGFAEQADRTLLRGALAGIESVAAASPEEEAEAVALMLRGALEEEGRTAALVTPDRTLARRVAARLEKWDLTVDDSAGQPLAKTPPAAFIELIVGCAESGFAPVPLMSLLKHPLLRLGQTPAATRSAARALELACFRQPLLTAGLEGARKALTALRGEDEAAHYRARARLRASELDSAAKLIDAAEAAFEPLATLYRMPNDIPLQQLARAHVQVAEALAREETGSCPALWRGEAGEALGSLLAELIGGQPTALRLRAIDYAAFLRSLFIGRLVRARRPAHARLFIWGPLEARLQQPDIVILGGLNDGTWPRHEDADAWLSRPMRRALGLSPPERRTGLAAHDVAQLMAAKRVVLTRATKVDGVPTVPSRWLLRLETLVKGLGLGDELKRGSHWVEWARRRDAIAEPSPAKRPEPKPPVAARPRKLSVTRIESWIANPYAIYARDILRLYALDPLAPEPEAATRGVLLHRVLHTFASEFPDKLPQDTHSALMRIANDLFKEHGAHPRVQAFWRPQFARFARWFAQTEPARRAGVVRVHSEINGILVIDAPGGPFTLGARADRIDVAGNGVAIYDYKTGTLPAQKDVQSLKAPQLPLEAAIAGAGGFSDIASSSVSALRFIRVGSGEPPGEERDAANGDPSTLAQTAVEELRRLVEKFDSLDTPYAALRRPDFVRAYRYDEYEHLSRLAEWLSADTEEDIAW